ncbi:MAG TPA: LD-carboxypeptidase [Anaeromyxobacter sp.]|nr:LD-carboxypeptidase [Anaeromyxobacter sp.]
MIVPPPLRRGDPVRVIAPSSPFDPDAFARGVEALSGRLGLVPRMRDDVVARRAYLAGDDARRIEEWREAVGDPEARAIFCARGGYGAMRILPAVDPAPLRERPKLLVGFSDVTALHAVLNRAGLATVHGPVVTQLGRAPEDALAHLEALLAGTAPRADAWGSPPPGAGVVAARTIRPGRASGPLLGGTLAILAHLAGTPFAPPLDGAILFLEEVGEAPYRIDRYLTHLRLAGALDGIAGLAVGGLTRCDDAGVLGADVVRDVALELGVPAIEGVPAGHDDANFALPLGARATLVAPAPGEEGPPRLLFDGWTAARGGGAA